MCRVEIVRGAMHMSKKRRGTQHLRCGGYSFRHPIVISLIDVRNVCCEHAIHLEVE
jgi:hypothetical protein